MQTSFAKLANWKKLLSCGGLMTSGNKKPIGQAALIEEYGLKVPAPAVRSVCGPGRRQSVIENGRSIEKYPMVYGHGNGLANHLKFSMKYEPTDLGVFSALFKTIERKELEEWVRLEHRGIHARRVWFLYEWLTGDTLDVPDLGKRPYVTALDEDLHVTAAGGAHSKRHKVIDNLLGSPEFCPTVRKTSAIQAYQNEGLAREAQDLISDCDPGTLARAVNFLYTKETKSTFEIEGEQVTPHRAERFVNALRAADRFDPQSSEDMLALQNAIVDPRYAATGLRNFQNFVGETVGGYREIVHFVCPKPEDVEGLMKGWGEMTARLKGMTDPVVAAAVISFGFVFIHPYEDGNGRIHRFLMHHILSSQGYTPPSVLFPISAAIVRDRKGYDEALESFSRAIKPYIDFGWGLNKEITVQNNTGDLYRYFDATKLTEYLYAKVEETVRKDLKDEINFIGTYDALLHVIKEMIDMPDRKASLLARLLIQNKGFLSKKGREMFLELTQDEISALEDTASKLLGDVDLDKIFNGSGSLYRP